MPIKFRCPHCRQFLGISRAKAGEIADCPMCGKTLRVPDLDGTVKPLPKPKLDLQDSSLVSALGELAGIGTEKAPSDREDHSAGNEQATVAVQPAPQPVVLEPLVPAEPVHVSAPPRARHQSTSRGPLDTASSAAIAQPPLAKAPQSSSEPVPSRSLRRVGRRPAQIWLPMTVVLGLLLLGAVGLFLMNRTAPTGVAAADTPTAGETAADDPGPQPEALDVPALTGRITYVSEAGDTRPDDGARIIVLPAQRGGTVKLDVAGFMVGSSEVDEQVAAAALRALGGNVVTANERGEYAMSLPGAGSFQLLVISRHQSRAWEVGVESTVQEMLDRFFMRPSTLLGQLAYEVQSFQYRGHGTSPRDFSFERD